MKTLCIIAIRVKCNSKNIHDQNLVITQVLTLITSTSMHLYCHYDSSLMTYLVLFPLIPAGIPVVIFGNVTVTSELNANPLTFNVTCISENGPVTSVVWTVDGSPVPSENNPITTRTVDNTTTGAYTLTLSVTGMLRGTYRCEVTSVRPVKIELSPGMHVTSAEMTVSGDNSSVIMYLTISLSMSNLLS